MSRQEFNSTVDLYLKEKVLDKPFKFKSVYVFYAGVVLLIAFLVYKFYKNKNSCGEPEITDIDEDNDFLAGQEWSTFNLSNLKKCSTGNNPVLVPIYNGDFSIAADCERFAMLDNIVANLKNAKKPLDKTLSLPLYFLLTTTTTNPKCVWKTKNQNSPLEFQCGIYGKLNTNKKYLQIGEEITLTSKNINPIFLGLPIGAKKINTQTESCAPDSINSDFLPVNSKQVNSQSYQLGLPHKDQPKYEIAVDTTAKINNCAGTAIIYSKENFTNNYYTLSYAEDSNAAEKKVKPFSSTGKNVLVQYPVPAVAFTLVKDKTFNLSIMVGNQQLYLYES